MSDNNKNFECSFCNRSRNQVKKLIASKHSTGSLSFICDKCIKICCDVIEKEDIIKEEHFGKLMTPDEILNELNLVVEGQERAKKLLAVAAYNHYKRIILNKIGGVQIDKSNLLLIGQSGSGKTLLASTLSKILKIPFITADATTMTEQGYVGDDADSCIIRLLQEANFDVNKAQQGIIFIDEVDKIRRMDTNGQTKDVSGEGVQHSLLKLIEGTVINVPVSGNKKNPQSDYVTIDTTNILFIFGGAFTGLEKIVRKRISNVAGFSSSGEVKSLNHYDEIMKEALPEDIVKYGLIQEFVGRVPVLVVLQELNEEHLISIFKNPKNALFKQYEKLFADAGAKLIFTDDAEKVIAKEALKLKTGARGLRTILDNLFLDTMFMLPSLKANVEVLITTDVVLKRIPPIISYVNNEMLASA